MFMPNFIHRKDVSGWMCCAESICFGNSCKLYMIIPLMYQNILINSLTTQSAWWYACCRLVTVWGTWENCKGWVDTPVRRVTPPISLTVFPADIQRRPWSSVSRWYLNHTQWQPRIWKQIPLHSLHPTPTTWEKPPLCVDYTLGNRY